MPESDTEQLIQRASDGDDAAIDELLSLHRARLHRMIDVHLDRDLMKRVDTSDVLQDTLIEAARRLPDYLRQRPIPFYPWLRRLAWDCLVEQRDRHLKTQKRSVHREARSDSLLSDHSAMQLADRLAACNSTPSQQAVRAEMQQRMRVALERLAEHDREVLVLRFLEQLSTRETAAVLQISESATRVRQLRALGRLRQLLGGDPSEHQP